MVSADRVLMVKIDTKLSFCMIARYPVGPSVPFQQKPFKHLLALRRL